MGMMSFAVVAVAQSGTPDAPAPQQPAAARPASEIPPSSSPNQNPGNQGGCYLPDASGKQVFVPNCGLSEAPQRRQPVQTPAAADPAKQFPFPGEPAAPAPASNSPARQAPATSGTAPASSNPAQAFPFPGEDKTPLVQPDGTVVPSDTPSAAGLKDAGSSGESSSSDSSSSSSSTSGSGGDGLAGLPDDPNSKGPLADDDTVIKKPRKKAPAVIAQTDSQREAEDLNVYGFYMDDNNFRGAYLRAADAVAHAPDDPNAHFALAEVARKLGKLDEALTQYKQTLTLDPIPKDKKAAEKAVKDMAGK